MNATFNHLFFLKKSNAKSNGEAPIYQRITIDGSKTAISINRSISPALWNNRLQRVIGRTDEVKELNAYLKTREQLVYDAHHQLLKDKVRPTPGLIKSLILGKDSVEITRTIVPIFQEHNRMLLELIPTGKYSKGTWDRYQTSLKHTIEFIQWKYKKPDIDINDIDFAFITDYDFYLRSVRKCGNNSTVKYLSNFRKIMQICLNNEWIHKNPFARYKEKTIEVEKEFLTQEEVLEIYGKNFRAARLEWVRDIFVFCCFTGLAYIDVKKLTPDHIRLGIDGQKWIFKNRQKTDTASKIPLLSIPEEIIDKYADNPKCQNSGVLLPVLSNQKMNSYLKEIADLCGITKNLTFHIARHTFATTITMANGVSMESVSKMLGHKNLRTTQHYAKILDKKVSEDMQLLASRLQTGSVLKKINDQ